MKTMKWLGGSLERLLEALDNETKENEKANIFNARLTVVAEYASTHELALKEYVRDSLSGQIINNSFYCYLNYVTPAYRSVPLRRSAVLNGCDIVSWVINNLPCEFGCFSIRLLPYGSGKKSRVWIFYPEV